MAFEPFDFKFNPPPTVASTPLTTSPASPGGPSVAGTSSVAGQIISQLDDLTAMSRYLQDAIVARTKNTAIQIDPAVDPDTAKALVSIYGTEAPPQYVTIGMYNQLLDAHFGALQLNMSVGKDSSVLANPFEIADLMQVVGTISQHLVNSPSYDNWLPLLLPSLKGDSIVFQSWKDSLNQYPATYATPTDLSNPNQAPIKASNLDLSPDLADYEQYVTQHFSQSYSVVYQSMASVGTVDADISNVLITYLDQDLGNMLRIVGCLMALVSFAHKTSMSNLVGDVANYSFVRLASEVTGMLHTGDMVAHLAAAPLKSGLGSLSGILGSVQNAAATLGRVKSGAMVGISVSNPCAQTNPYSKIASGGEPSKPLTVPGIGKLSGGLQTLGEKLDWALNKIDAGSAGIDLSFRQLMERRLKNHDDTNSIMCSIKATMSLINAANAVIAAYKANTVAPAASVQVKQTAVNSILTSLQTGSSTTFTTSSNQVVVNAPDMPPTSEPVNRVLSRAKIHTTKGSIQTT